MSSTRNLADLTALASQCSSIRLKKSSELDFVQQRIHEAPPLQDEDVKGIVETTAHRVVRLLERRGILGMGEFDDFAQEQPVLAGMTKASILGLVATGDRRGMPVRRVLQDPAEGIKTGELCYASRGFSLHAATRIAAGNKAGLERLCNYVARPPLAAGSLERISDEEYSFRLKTPWRDGTTHLILSPLELIEKLAALVPPPRQSATEEFQ